MNTTEIYLRAPEPEDLDFLLQLENESEAMEAGTPATGPYSRFQLKRYIAQNTNDLYTDRELRLMIGLSATASMNFIYSSFVQKSISFVLSFPIDPALRAALLFKS